MEIHIFSFKKINFKMSSEKMVAMLSRPQCVNMWNTWIYHMSYGIYTWILCLFSVAILSVLYGSMWIIYPYLSFNCPSSSEATLKYMSKTDQNHTIRKCSKVWTICIILGIYCIQHYLWDLFLLQDLLWMFHVAHVCEVAFLYSPSVKSVCVAVNYPIVLHGCC